jgi:hypothetical protein
MFVQASEVSFVTCEEEISIFFSAQVCRNSWMASAARDMSNSKAYLSYLVAGFQIAQDTHTPAPGHCSVPYIKRPSDIAKPRRVDGHLIKGWPQGEVCTSEAAYAEVTSYSADRIAGARQMRLRITASFPTAGDFAGWGRSQDVSLTMRSACCVFVTTITLMS